MSHSADEGQWVVVPEPGVLSSWEAAVRASGLTTDQAATMRGIARLMRRAVIVDGARPGDPVWIGYDALVRATNGLAS